MLILQAITLSTNRQSKFSRNLVLTYEAAKQGIYIQGISGKLYTKDKWSNQEDANGVAVIHEKGAFVFADFSVLYGYLFDSDVIDDTEASNFTFIPSVKDIISEETMGDVNTDKLELYAPSTFISSVREKTSPMGDKGYIPSIYELTLFFLNLDAIEEMYNLIS